MIGSASGTDLIFKRLSRQAPQHYRRGVRAAIIATIASYTLAFVSIQLEQPWSTQAHPRELYVIGAGLAAVWIERQGRARWAAGLVLGAVWLELHLTLLTLGARAAVGGVFPAILAGVILFFGTRAGAWAALSSLLTVPGFVLAGPLLGVGPGLQSGDLIYLVAIEACTLAIAFPLQLLMNTLSGVLGNAERDARRLRELFDGAPDPIVVVNSEGRIEDSNPSAHVLFGKEHEELVGSRFVDLGLSRAKEGTQSQAIDIDALGAEAQEFLGPPLHDGEPGVPLEGVARTVEREDGSRDCLVVLRDISQSKLSAQLQRQLQQSQKLEALGKLAGGVAHDFNNLLMAVGGYAESLGRHDDPAVRDVARSLLGLRRRAAGLTEHLMAFAKKGMTQPRPLELSRAVNESPRLLEPLIEPKITLRIEAPEPAFIHADPAQIEQVLLNLAINARDAMPSGGTLTISCQLLPEAGRVELRVADTGHGMDEATRRSAFEPFFTTKPRTQGTGLGLALVHGIVEASGGTIRLESTPGRGTEFTLSWPALRLGTDTQRRLRITDTSSESASQHQ
ncbi:MAG TPA: ATP-binding protein [Polyangiaceae bacterium]|nr:ATP-binding protein [Polyangiaceae bacterium]